MASLIEPPIGTMPLPAAAGRAQALLEGNLQALRQTQPALAALPMPIPAETEFVFGRDGALTARISDQWLSGCSLPRRAAEHLLRNFRMRGIVGCLLYPTHAVQLRSVLDRLGPHQAVIAILEETTDLALMLHCADLAADIRNQRLWFAVGRDWPAALGNLLDIQGGLPIPDQFIRTGLNNATQVGRSIDIARPLLKQAADRRTAQRTRRRQQWHGRSSRPHSVWCVMAGSRFKLWDNAPARLWTILDDGSGHFARYDPDRPAAASLLALADAALSADGLITADLGRADFPALLPDDMPWIAWITRPRMPAADKAGPRDRLLLADPAWMPSARCAGWDADRLDIARWPTPPGPSAAARPADPRRAALIVDTRPIDPEPAMDLSSHRLLWQTIAHDIAADPWAIHRSGGEQAYLAQRRADMEISDIGFDARPFLGDLIRPAYHQALARRLIDLSWSLDLWGEGWNELDAFSAQARGPVLNARAFQSAVERSDALVHPALDPSVCHEIDSLGRPVLRLHGHSIRITQPQSPDPDQALSRASLPAALGA